MSGMKRAGYAAVATAAVLWAAGGAYASYLIDEGADFVELTEARAWITAVVLAGVTLLRRPSTEQRPARWLIVLFGLSIAAANVFYYASLSRLPVAIAITTQYTAPGLVVLWAALAERARPSRIVVGALGAAVAGVALLAEVPVVVAEGKLRLDGLGFLFAGLSAVAFASYMVSGERVGRSLGSRGAVLRGFVVASILWLFVQVARGRPDTLLEPRFAFGIAFLAIFTTIAPFLLFVWGLERVSASEAGIVSTLEPLTAAVIAFVWLDQTLSGWQIAGALLVIVGIGLVQAERPMSADALAERAAVE
jgi:drug/metabolite transporter (DMT)-like permease